jgi:preprotein translocase subunit SecF
MDFLRNTHIDFMKDRKFFIGFSYAIMIVGAIAVFFLGKLNMGIDFVGGTQLTLKFAAEPDVAEIRDVLGRAGLKESQIQRFGKPGENEILVRTPIVEGSEEGAASRILEALSQHYNQADAAADLNQIGTGSIAQLLVAANPDGVAGEPEAVAAHYTAVAESVMAVRKGQAIFRSWDEVAGIPGLTAKALDGLKSSATIGEFSPLATERRPAGRHGSAGADSRRHRRLAGDAGLHLIRFELRFAIGATMASLHVLITLSYAFMGYEFPDHHRRLPDPHRLLGERHRGDFRPRAREYVALRAQSPQGTERQRTRCSLGRYHRRDEDFASLMLYLGGDVIKGFAFIMLTGIIIGTYSSIYIASPFALLWEKWFPSAGRDQGVPKSAQRPATSKAR